ncbi:MAG: hypothetical protein DWQ02_12735 [Bacteroidetes bacterium]|nr:MAG: hypothetical protein DWQ02_12735 [Bacteroidota bacterium]
MDAKFYLIALPLLVILLMIFSFCKPKGKSSIEIIEHGPFKLTKKRIVERRFDFNRGERVKSAYSQYEVFYKNEVITFPDALEVNTGYSYVWKAFILADAPQPAIIAGSQSMYLITEEHGAVNLKPLNEQNSSFASWQWLDSHDGQPLGKQQIYISEDTGDHFTLKGGDYLLINENTVLHIPDLSVYAFRKSADFTDNYYTGRVVAFSPGKEEVVFVGNKDSEERYDKYLYALLVYNFKTNAAYAVPFDQTETRLKDQHYITPEWLNTYFEWQASPNGTFTLKKRVLSELPNWQGHFTGDFSYELNPVKAGIQEALLQVIKEMFSLTDADITLEDSGYSKQKVYRLMIEDHEYSLYYFEELQTVSFSKDLLEEETDEVMEVVKRVGEAFNDELILGKYQDLFTEF